MKKFFSLLGGVFFSLAAFCQADADKDSWITLFNGKDINDWIPKINHHYVGENYGNTFRVEDSIIKIRYDQYDKFNTQFGHLYYKKPFS